MTTPPEAGLVFDGRISEDFKLTSGTWVATGNVRLNLLSAVNKLLDDVVICGENRPYLTAMAWLSFPAVRELLAASRRTEGALAAQFSDAELLKTPFVADALARSFAHYNAAHPGSSTRIRRVLLLDTPPSLDETSAEGLHQPAAGDRAPLAGSRTALRRSRGRAHHRADVMDQQRSERWPKRYGMMTWLLVALLLCYIDRVLMSVAAIEMQKEFGWTDSDKGFVLSSFFVGYLITQILGGLVSNRLGGRNTFLVAVVLWSLFTALTPAAASWSFGAVVVARFMLGFGEGAAYPAAYNLIHGWMPFTERSRSIGLMTASGAAGTVIALLSVGSIIQARGWPSVFYLFGSMGIVWALIWTFVIPSRPPGGEVLANARTAAKGSIPWRVLLTHPAVLTLYLLCTAGGSISFVMVSWLPSYFVDVFGLTTAQAGIYSVVPFATMAVIPVLSGRYADKLIAARMTILAVRKRLVITGMFVVALSLVLLTLAPSAIASVVLASLLFVGVGIAVVGYSPIPAELLPEHGDILFGFMAAAGSLASAAAVAITGVLLERTGSYAAMFIVLALLSGASLLAFQFFGRATRIEQLPLGRLQPAKL